MARLMVTRTSTMGTALPMAVVKKLCESGQFLFVRYYDESRAPHGRCVADALHLRRVWLMLSIHGKTTVALTITSRGIAVLEFGFA